MAEEIKKPENAGDSRDEQGRFIKGQSGNPEGKKPGTFSLIPLLKAELQKCPDGQDKKTYADMLIKKILKEAIENGSDSQIRNILNYVDGMPRQDITSGGMPLPLLGGQSNDKSNNSNQQTPETKKEDKSS